MSETTTAGLKERISQLTAHLERENPELLAIVRSFRRLDKVAHRLGLLERSDSYATQVTWWPLISVLGTFSSGKSTFINSLLGQPLQATGNQAVDDKFTVICYGREDTPRVLPGLALDSDPRFPFYKISREIDEAMAGEGQRLDSYLQLKTCNSEQLRGKIIIDSPGFDADAQRTSTLRITNHIVDLSDLVLVFFDARHPEPGAMQDTLEYLVEGTLRRPDFNKFLHILNQIDNAAREDNPEEVFAAWQRALAAKGLTAGRFYRIYDPASAIPIEDERLRQRFEHKRAEDLQEIIERIEHLEVERSYRVAGKLEQTAKRIRDEIVPRLEAARRSWKRRTLWFDGLAFGAILVALLLISNALGYWQGLSFSAPWLDTVTGTPWLLWGAVIVIAAGALQLHRVLRRLASRAVVKRLRRDESLGEEAEAAAAAFEKNVRSWWPFFLARPLGWGVLARRRIDTVLREADKAIQELNDRYTNPSGGAASSARAAMPAAAAAPTSRTEDRPAAPETPASQTEGASAASETPAPQAEGTAPETTAPQAEGAGPETPAPQAEGGPEVPETPAGGRAAAGGETPAEAPADESAEREPSLAERLRRSRVPAADEIDAEDDGDTDSPRRPSRTGTHGPTGSTS